MSAVAEVGERGIGNMTGSAAHRGIIWTDDFLIGIEELDHEHRCLIEDINQLHHFLVFTIINCTNFVPLSGKDGVSCQPR